MIRTRGLSQSPCQECREETIKRQIFSKYFYGIKFTFQNGGLDRNLTVSCFYGACRENKNICPGKCLLAHALLPGILKTEQLRNMTFKKTLEENTPVYILMEVVCGF